MAKTYDVPADWRKIDPTSLPAPIAKAYADYKEAYAFAKSQREAFELAMSSAAALPDTSRLAFGYNFGNLTIAVIPNDKPKSRPSQSATLADFLRTATLNGART